MFDAYLGKRVYDNERNEVATIVELDLSFETPDVFLLQYANGRFWDEAFAKNLRSEKVEADEGELLGDRLELLEQGPNIQDACDHHDWYPSPDQLADSAAELDEIPYARIVRCRKCGLLGSTVFQLGVGQKPPRLCADCSGVVEDGELEYTGELGSSPLCASCAEDYE